MLCAHARRGALFGMAIEVFFESTTPLLHLLGCLKIADRSKGRLYFLAGEQWMLRFCSLSPHVSESQRSG